MEKFATFSLEKNTMRKTNYTLTLATHKLSISQITTMRINQASSYNSNRGHSWDKATYYIIH